MNSIALPRQRTAWTRLWIAGVIALFALLCGTTAANAHDDLIGSTPESGSTVTEAPSQIVLNYSGQLQTLADDGGTVVVITNTAGEQIPNEFEVTGREVTITPGSELTNGEYTVASRVISSDGHPVEKSISFTVDTGEEASEPTQTAPAEASPSDAEPQNPVEELSADGGPNTVLWIVLGVVAAGAAIAVLVNFARRNNTK